MAGNLKVRPRVEEELKRVRTILETTFASLNEVVMVIDPHERTIISCNEAIKHVFGYDKNEVVGLNTAFLFTDRKEYDKFGRLLFDSLNREGTFSIEYQMRRRDGSVFFSDHTVTEILDDSGKRTGVVSVVRDITERKRSEGMLRDSEEKYRGLFENTSNAIMIFDAETLQIEDVNDACLRLYGYTREEFLSMTPVDISGETEKTRDSVKAIIDGSPGAYHVPFRYHKKKDGILFPVEILAGCFYSRGRKKVVGTIVDLTERKLVAEALEKEKAFIDNAINTLQDMFFVFDLEGRFLKWNRIFNKVTGYGDIEIASMRPTDFFTGEDVNRVAEAIDKAVKQGHAAVEAAVVTKDGRTIRYEFTGSLLMDHRGKPFGISGVGRDITERSMLHEKLRHDAQHDALTGLANRILFTERLYSSLVRLRGEKGYAFAVLFLDLDRFKNVNDTMGHAMGDRLLIAVAERLRQCLRPYDTIARLGGDEFAILIEDIETNGDALNAAERIKKEINAPFKLDEHEVFVTTSIGIVLSGPEYRQPELMLRDADIAMYQAKCLGKNCHVVFDEGMHARVLSNSRLENDLRHAVEKNELLLHYQPIVSVDIGRITGFEALLRWKSQTGEMIPPAKFIPIAEETGLIIPIGRCVFYEACRQMSLWQKKFSACRPLEISINFSSRQLKPNPVDQIKEILLETGLSPSSLIIEITESTIMEDPETAASLILQLKEINIKIHIDDFGTGYSSLNYLHKLPLDALKIDRSFIAAMCSDEYAMEIVKAVIAMAHSLKKYVIAEGVETAGQLEELRKLRCDYFQGYLCSKPLGRKEAEALLKNLD